MEFETEDPSLVFLCPPLDFVSLAEKVSKFIRFKGKLKIFFVNPTKWNGFGQHFLQAQIFSGY